MDAAAREKAGEVIVRFGQGILDEPRRFESILSDVFAGGYRRERIALVTAVRERVPNALRGSSNAQVPPGVLLAQITDRLTNSTAMDSDAARWAVETLALLMHVPVPAASTAPDVQAPQKTVMEPPSAPDTYVTVPEHPRADVTVPTADLTHATVREPAFIPPPPARPPIEAIPAAGAWSPTTAVKKRSVGKTIGIVVLWMFGVLGFLLVVLLVIGLSITKSSRQSGSAPRTPPVPAAVSANSFLGYRDGATRTYRCTSGSKTFDVSEEIHAVSMAGVSNLALFRDIIKYSTGEVSSDTIEGIDAEGNGYFVGAYTNNVLSKETTPVLILPADPKPGFVVRWMNGGGQEVRTFVRDSYVKMKSGGTVREALYSDVYSGRSSYLLFVSGYGLFVDNFGATSTMAAINCQRHSNGG